jgi:hypothetical protein
VKQLIILTMAMIATWAVIFGAGFAFVRWRLGRANRVSPSLRSPAPLYWLWSPRLTARLHRRLRIAVGLIHLAPTRRVNRAPSLSVDELRRELEYQAVELDGHLVVAARHPRSHRRGLLANLERQVAEVERLAVRLSHLVRSDGVPATGWEAEQPSSPEALDRISDQLDLLDAARVELGEIERASGLVDVDSLLRDTQSPVAVNPPPPREPLPLHTRRTGRVRE